MSLITEIRTEAEKIKEVAETAAQVKGQEHKIWSHLIAAASGAAIAVAIMAALA